MSERKVKRAYGYARVSTPSQDLDAQIEKIQKFCTYRGIERMEREPSGPGRLRGGRTAHRCSGCAMLIS